MNTIVFLHLHLTILSKTCTAFNLSEYFHTAGKQKHLITHGVSIGLCVLIELPNKTVN